MIQVLCCFLIIKINKYGRLRLELMLFKANMFVVQNTQKALLTKVM